MHFSQIFTFAAFALGASALSITNPLEAQFEKRDLPPCTKCPVSDGDWLSNFRPDDPGTPEDQSEIYPEGWLPKAAETHGYTCYDLGPGVTFSSGGIESPYGSWVRTDGSSVMCWEYWQSTLQFVGASATVNSYPAHCVVYTYVKGPAARVSINGSQVLPNGNELGQCFGTADNIDIGVTSIYLDDDSE